MEEREREFRRLAADFRELAERERECCPFLSLDVRRTETSIVLELSAPAEAAAILDDIYALAS